MGVLFIGCSYVAMLSSRTNEKVYCTTFCDHVPELVEVVKMSRVVVSSSRDVDSVACLHLVTYGRVILLF